MKNTIYGFIDRKSRVIQIDKLIERNLYNDLIPDSYIYKIEKRKNEIDIDLSADGINVYALPDKLKSGDTLVTSTMNNISRDYNKCFQFISTLLEKKIRVVFIQEQIDTDQLDIKTLQLFLKGCNRYKELGDEIYTREKSEKSAAAGKNTLYSLENIADFDSYYEKIKNKEMNRKEVAKALGMSLPTLRKLMRQKESAQYKTNSR